METIKIRLPKRINLVYNNPLKLGSTEIREVEKTPMICNLLHAGAIELAKDIKPIRKTTVVNKKFREQTKHTSFEKELKSVKGIGEKRVKDLLRHYNTKRELKDALKKDKVSLRDDIVEKLRKFYKVIK